MYKSKKGKKKKKMYDGQQHFVDLQENSSTYGDPNSWLSGGDSIPNSSPTHSQSHPSLGGPTHNPNLDRVLFKDLVEIVPLVQSLIVRALFNFLFSFTWVWFPYTCLFSSSFIFSFTTLLLHFSWVNGASLLKFKKLGIY